MPTPAARRARRLQWRDFLNPVTGFLLAALVVFVWMLARSAPEDTQLVPNRALLAADEAFEEQLILRGCKPDDGVNVATVMAYTCSVAGQEMPVMFPRLAIVPTLSQEQPARPPDVQR
jgi:hypothetical protein